MNVVNSGSRFQIYGEDVATFKALPPITYEVEFSQNSGFFLTMHPNLELHEEKIYGNHTRRLEKVFRTFKVFERNFGLILSGVKGSGKSLFARGLAEKAMKNGYPVILVKQAIPGIASFLSSIEQEAVIIFDEFDKTFAETEDYNPQIELLSMFDGLDCGKKMFVITCNNVGNLNEFLINRPGRFHYHFVIGVPSVEEVQEYLEDKLLPEYHDSIFKIVKLSLFSDVTYDSLRAFVFELNNGNSFSETLEDLNLDLGENTYDITVYFDNGSKAHAYGTDVNIFEPNRVGRWYDWDTGKDSIFIQFDTEDIEVKDNKLYIPGNKAAIRSRDNSWDDDEENKKPKESMPSITEIYLKKWVPAKPTVKNVV